MITNKIARRTSDVGLEPSRAMINFLMFLSAMMALSAIIFKYMPAIPEPELPIGTPFGKLRFFDGMILYGFVILVLLGLISEFLP